MKIQAHPTAQRGARAGFSLIELMMAVLVLGLIVSVVSVSFDRILPGQQLNSAVRGISSRLHSARSEAIARAKEYQVVYNLEQDTYWMLLPFDEEGRFQPDPEKRRRVNVTKLQDGVHFHEITIDGKAYNIGDVEVFVRFDPLGASNDHTVTLRQENPERYSTVEVLGLTGLIRFHKDFFERDAPTDTDFQ